MPFDSPNYTQLPNDLLGDWNKPSLMSQMSESELKVVLAICRLTFGYHRRKVRAALPILMEMTGLSKQGVINGTKAAEERGLIQRVSQPGRGKIATWEVVTTEKVNDLDLFKNGQNNGPFEEEKVNNLDSKGQQNRHMKESNKEIDSLKEKEGASPTLRQQAKRGEMTPEQEAALLCDYGRQGKVGIADPSQDIEAYMQTADEFIKVYRERTGLWPDKNVQKPAIKELAQDGADLELWDRVVTAWVKVGWNKRNVAGMIECYQRGEIPSTKPNGGKHAHNDKRRVPRGVPAYSVADPAEFHDQSQDDAGA